jgi:hypothetical protein
MARYDEFTNLDTAGSSAMLHRLTDAYYNKHAKQNGCTAFQSAMWLQNGLRVDERGILIRA